MLSNVDLRNFQSFPRDIDRIHLRSWERLCTRDGNTTGACAYIEYALHPLGIDPGRELALNELSQRGTGNEHTGIDVERKSREPGLVREIHGRYAFFDPALNEFLSALSRGDIPPLA